MKFSILAVILYFQVIDGARHAPENCLFPDLNGDYSKYQAMLDGIEILDPSCFYGRPLGFQVGVLLFLILSNAFAIFKF